MEEERKSLFQKIVFLKLPTLLYCILSLLFGYMVGYFVRERSAVKHEEYSQLFIVCFYIIGLLFGYFVVGDLLVRVNK